MNEKNGEELRGETAENGQILLKGGVQGLRLIIPEHFSGEELRKGLQEILSGGKHILQGARIVFDLQGRATDAGEILWILEHFIWPGNVSVLSWVTYSAETLEILRRSGFPTGEPAPTGHAAERTHRSLVLERSLRSGQRVEHGGDVVIVGSVNDGAEVFAGGNIVVWGRLQGIAHAGSEGNADARILTRVFEASQVRIGRKVSYVDKDSSWWGKSVVIGIEDETFIVRPLTIQL